MDDRIETRFKNVSKSATFKNIVGLFDLRKKKVLDLGCSYGEFLAHFSPGSVGVTLAEEEVAYGKKKGLDIRPGNIEEGELPVNETFDVVFANNLFEHLYSPHGFLFRVKRLLRPDGVLILGVPCIPKIASLSRLRKFRGALASAHINFFTRETLTRTVERAGWNILAVRGFHFRMALIDRFLNPIYPHFYVIAVPDPSFVYPEKRQKELAGYVGTGLK